MTSDIINQSLPCTHSPFICTFSTTSHPTFSIFCKHATERTSASSNAVSIASPLTFSLSFTSTQRTRTPPHLAQSQQQVLPLPHFLSRARRLPLHLVQSQQEVIRLLPTLSFTNIIPGPRSAIPATSRPSTALSFRNMQRTL